MEFARVVLERRHSPVQVLVQFYGLPNLEGQESLTRESFEDRFEASAVVPGDGPRVREGVKAGGLRDHPKLRLGLEGHGLLGLSD